MHCPQNISRCTVLRISNSQVTNLITYRVYQESHYLWISLASYGISRLLQNYDFHYQIQRNMELDPVLSQLKPVVTVTACCFKVCLCNTIPPFRFPPPSQKRRHFNFCPPYKSYVSAYDFLLFYYTNAFYENKVMKYLCIP